MNLFEIATRCKYRFRSSQGILNIEDLWHIDLASKSNQVANLNSIAIEIHQSIQALSVESFVSVNETPKLTELQNKLDIVKHIIAYKQSIIEKAKQSKERAIQREKLKSALETKEESEISNLTKEELLKRLKELD